MTVNPRGTRRSVEVMMKRSGATKFPNSVQLFKFCQKVMMHQRGGKVRDQEVGAILDFNPSDCSHWKRGEKNVKSVFALARLSDALGVETSLIYDVASGHANLDEAFFEYNESRTFKNAVEMAVASADEQKLADSRAKIEEFVKTIHEECEFKTPPLYLPEVMRSFAFVSAQTADMLDKLSRILRVKPGQYAIHYKKGDLRPQTRLSVVKDLARIILEGERARFPELGAADAKLLPFEQITFAANLLVPKPVMMQEMAKADLRRNVVSELAAMFWVPKSLICFQMQDILRTGERLSKTYVAETERSPSVSAF